MKHEGYGSPRNPEGNRRAYGWLTEGLSARLPGMAVVLRPVLRVLAGRDLVRDTAVGTLDYVPRWVVTETGEWCLAMLEERGPEDSDRAEPTPPSS